MATYDDCIGIYATIKASAKPGSVWAGEMAQFGVRIAVSSATSPPDLNSGQLVLDRFAVRDASVTRQHGIWDVQQGFVSGGGPSTFTDSNMDTIADAFEAWRDGCDMALSPQYDLHSVTLHPFAATSRAGYPSAYFRAGPTVYTPKVAKTWGKATTTQAPNSALAVSLGTATRGRLGRGRIFLGPLGGGVNADGLLDTAARDLFSASAVLLFDRLRFSNQIGNVDAAPCFWPMVYNRPGGKTQQTGEKGSPVSFLRIGNQLDVQQRRRRQVPEIYTRYPLT